MSALSQSSYIKQLTLSQLRNLDDMSFVSSMSGLQFLSVSSIKKLETLPSFDELPKLRRVFLESLRDLKDIKSLKSAPNLQEFIYQDVNDHVGEYIAEVLENPVLKEVRIKFSDSNKNAEFLKHFRESGKGVFKPRKFEFEP